MVGWLAVALVVGVMLGFLWGYLYAARRLYDKGWADCEADMVRRARRS